MFVRFADLSMTWGAAMSYVVAIPEALVAAASDLAGIGSMLSTANAAAAASTTGVLAAGADEVSAAITSLFSSHAQDFQALSTQAAAFHDQLVHLLNGGANSYASTEAANAQRNLLSAVNSPAQALLGRPLIGNGVNGAPGTGANGGGGGGFVGSGGGGGGPGGAGDRGRRGGGRGGGG